MALLTFLGTGNYLAPGRYWNSFVVDGRILVEPSPTCLPHLRRCGIPARAVDTVVISHFHADHTFGWPFLLLERMLAGRDRPLHVVGPPGVEQFLGDMLELGAVPNILEAVRETLDVDYVEVDGTWQQVGSLRLRAVEVDHVDHLRCFGYLLERDGMTLGYSGDTRPCAGLDELAGAADVLVLECNGAHEPKTHMDEGDVADLRRRFPDTPFVLTHLGEHIDVAGIPGVHVPEDFDVVDTARLDARS